MVTWAASRRHDDNAPAQSRDHRLSVAAGVSTVSVVCEVRIYRSVQNRYGHSKTPMTYPPLWEIDKTISQSLQRFAGTGISQPRGDVCRHHTQTASNTIPRHHVTKRCDATSTFNTTPQTPRDQRLRRRVISRRRQDRRDTTAMSPAAAGGLEATPPPITPEVSDREGVTDPPPPVLSLDVTATRQRRHLIAAARPNLPGQHTGI